MPEKASVQRKPDTPLIKMLLAILAIGLAAGLLSPTHCCKRGGAQSDTARCQMKGFSQALDMYLQDVGHYPVMLCELITSRDPKWDGPYLRDVDEVPKDPWGHDYVYAMDASRQDYALLSCGGGEGELVYKDTRHPTHPVKCQDGRPFPPPLLQPVLNRPRWPMHRPKRTPTRMEIEGVIIALNSYHRNLGHYPKSLEGLVTPIEKNWGGPYFSTCRGIRQVPVDPWGHDYFYAVSRDGKSYTLLSRGAETIKTAARLTLPPLDQPRRPGKLAQPRPAPGRLAPDREVLKLDGAVREIENGRRRSTP